MKEKEKQGDHPTQEQSMTLMRNLLRTTVSSICYLRHIFPEECFHDKQLCGINIKSLVPRMPEVSTLCNWLEEGLFDALTKKYLRVVYFGISSDPEEETALLECYIFRFSYLANGEVVLDMHKENSAHPTQVVMPKQPTKSDIKKATIGCLRNLITISQTLKPLPEMNYLTMKLLYYDAVTPPHYEPKFFRSAMYSDPFYWEPDAIKVKIGEVATPFHKFSVQLKTTVDLFEEECLVQNEESEDEVEPAATPKRPILKRKSIVGSPVLEGAPKKPKTSDDAAKTVNIHTTTEETDEPAAATTTTEDKKPAKPADLKKKQLSRKFEICNSQEATEGGRGASSKKHKCSKTRQVISQNKSQAPKKKIAKKRS
eukprot:TRINITY_DN4198_c1_g1_i1.p1 TRINITY_DN4198_c1_g1~~TRINITY_DN4198_c1_g1_i1.p1  ORF type:complete len:370 (-),score=72.76 TRINITY_DN4198_c1_g1_i1:105-1214(-)